MAARFFEEFYKCPECGFVMLIWRSKGQLREKFHKKWLYCIICADERNFIKAEGSEVSYQHG